MAHRCFRAGFSWPNIWLSIVSAGMEAQIARGGTLFLDEIGDMPLVLQPKLLRFLQEQEFMRLGGNEVLRSDVRIVAATHRDLQSMVKAGLFREDLLNRLEVFTINVPPLRDRPGDILPLAWHFIKKNADLRQVPVTQMDPEVQRLFREAPGPGTSAGWKTRSFTRWAMEILSPKPSQALSPNDLGDSFGARIFRDAKTRAVFPSRYSGKAKLAQFSRPDIAGKQKSRSFPVPI